MSHFTHDNMPGCTDEELAALNAEFGIRLAWFLAEHPEVPQRDLTEWVKAFDEKVRARPH